MPFIVPGTAQFTVNGTFQGRAIANVFHYFIDTTGAITQRPTAVFDMAGIVLNQWNTDIMPLVSNGYTFTSVSYLDLDSSTGTVGNRTSTTSKTLPLNGGLAGGASSANVAALIRKNVSGQRGVRKGRTYLCGLIEVDTDALLWNQLTTAKRTALQTASTSFLGNTNQTAGGPFVYDSRMCVAHVLTRGTPKKVGRPGPPETGEHINVSSMSVDVLLATQRRRLRG